MNAKAGSTEGCELTKSEPAGDTEPLSPPGLPCIGITPPLGFLFFISQNKQLSTSHCAPGTLDTTFPWRPSRGRDGAGDLPLHVDLGAKGRTQGRHRQHPDGATGRRPQRAKDPEQGSLPRCVRTSKAPHGYVQMDSRLSLF